MFSSGWFGSPPSSPSKKHSTPADAATADSPTKRHSEPVDVAAAAAALSPNGQTMSGANLRTILQPTGPSELQSPEGGLGKPHLAAEGPPAVAELESVPANGSASCQGLPSLPSDASESRGAEVDNLAELQLQWERQAASAEAKQAEIFHSQWNMAREQICMCSRELLTLCSQVRAIRVDLDAEIAQRREIAVQLDAKLEEFKGNSRDAERDNELQQHLRNVESQVSAQMDVLRVEIEAEVRERGASEQRLKRECEDLRSALSAETARREVELSKHQRSLQSFQDEHARARPSEVQRELLGDYRKEQLQLWKDVEVEVRERQLADKELRRECEELRSMLCRVAPTQACAASRELDAGPFELNESSELRAGTAVREAESICNAAVKQESANPEACSVREVLQPVDPSLETQLEKVRQEVERVRHEIAEAHAISKEELLKLQGLQAEQVSAHVAEAFKDIESLRTDLKSGAESVIRAAAEVEQKATRQELQEVTDTLRQEFKVFAASVQDLDNKLNVTQSQKQEESNISSGEREALAAALEQVQHEFHAGNEEALNALKEERAQLEALRIDLDAEVSKRSLAEDHLRQQCEKVQGELEKHAIDIQELRNEFAESRAPSSPTEAEAPESQEADAGTADLRDARYVIEQLEELMAQVADNKQVAQELISQVASEASRVDAHSEAAAERVRLEVSEQVDLLRKDFEAELQQRNLFGEQFRLECDELRGVLESESSRHKEELSKHEQTLKQECDELRVTLKSETSRRADEFSEHQQVTTQACEGLRGMINSEVSSRRDEVSKHWQAVQQECEELRGMLEAQTFSAQAEQLRKDFEAEVYQRNLGYEHLKRECEELRSKLGIETASFSELLSKHWQALKRQCEELRGLLSAETATRTEELSNQQQALKIQCEQMRALLSAEISSQTDELWRQQQALKRECAEFGGLLGTEISSRTDEFSKFRQVLKRECEELHGMLTAETSHRAGEFSKHQHTLKRECEELRGMISAETSNRTEELSKHQQAYKRECDELRAMLSAETCSRTEELARHRQSLHALQRARTEETCMAAAAVSNEQAKEDLMMEHQHALKAIHEEREHVDQLKGDVENELRNHRAAGEELKREFEDLRRLLDAESAGRASALAKHRQELQALHEERAEELSASLQQARHEFDEKHQKEAQSLHQVSGQLDSVKNDIETGMRERSAAEQQLRRDFDELLATVSPSICSQNASASNSSSKRQAVQEGARNSPDARDRDLAAGLEQLRQEFQAKDEDRIDEAAATNFNIQGLRHEMEKDRKERAAQCAQMRLLYDELQERVETLLADEANHGLELRKLHGAVQHEAQLREKGVGHVCLTLEQLQARLEATGSDPRAGHARRAERQELCTQAKVEVLPPSLDITFEKPDLESQSGPEVETTADSQAGSLVRKQQEDRCWDTSSSPVSLTPPFSFSSTQGCSGGSAIHRPEDSFNNCHVCSESVDEIKRELTSWLRKTFDDECKVRAQGAEQSDPLCQDAQCKLREKYTACVSSGEDLSAKTRTEISIRLHDMSQRIDSFSHRFQEEIAVEKQERMREVSEIRSSLLGMGIADLTREAQALRWHFDPTLQTCGEDEVSKCHFPQESGQFNTSCDSIVVLRQDLVAERDQRIEEVSRLVCNFQCLENQISRQLQEIHEQTKSFGAILPAEAGDSPYREDHSADSGIALFEIQSELVALREALESETRIREDGSSALQQLQQQVDTDCNERAREVAYLAERLRFAPNMQERDDSLRSELLTYRSKIAEDHATLSQGFEDLQSQVAAQLERLKEHLLARISDCTAGERSLIRRDLEADLGGGGTAVEDVQRELAALRQDLDHYAKMSARNNETTTTGLRHIQEKFEIECGKRTADVAELSENMQLESVSTALRLEIRKIQDGTIARLGEFQGNLEGLESRVAEHLAKIKPCLQEMIASSSVLLPEWKDQTNGMLRRLQEQLDMEAEERSRAMAGFTEHLRSLPDALTIEVHEHVQEFREDLEAQAVSMRRELLTEKEERAIEGAALRCSIQGLEGRTEEKLAELQCGLDGALSVWKAFKSSALKFPGCAEQLNSSSPTAHKQLDLETLEGATAIASS